MSDQPSSTDESHALREMVWRWIRVGWQHPNRAEFEELHNARFVDHSPSGRPATLEGFWQGVVELYAAFPDFWATVEDVITEPQVGKVTIRWSGTGTHRGEFLGIQPTGRQIHFEGIEIIRVENRRIAERWGEWNGIGILQQLGRWR